MAMWVNGEYDFPANSNLRKSFLNLNEEMENIGGISSIEVLGVFLACTKPKPFRSFGLGIEFGACLGIPLILLYYS
jgi:hypothetical protein